MLILAYLLNALLYGALALYFWRTRWVPAGPNPGPSGVSPGRLFCDYGIISTVSVPRTHR